MKPSPHASRDADRLEGLSETGRQLLAEATSALQRRDAATLARQATALRALAPHHPEVLRLLAAVALLQGRAGDAVTLLREAAGARGNDTLVLANLAQALAGTGQTAEAVGLMRRCTELEPARAEHGLALAQLLERTGDVEAAVAVLDGVLERAPSLLPARIARARALFVLGRGDEAAAEYRRVLAQAPDTAAAWYGLATLRRPSFDAADIAAMERLLGRRDLADPARASLGFALARACENLDRADAAWDALVAANRLWRRHQSWDGQAMSRHVRAIRSAFAAASSDGEPRGTGLVFIVGLPRSGSSIIEQILAAHPDVAAGGELEHATAIVRAESMRRQRDFPHWVAEAGAADWKRLGEAYLARIRAQRQERRVFTDKGLLNWLYLGALQRMLPGARFIDSRRDPLETCIACYRQMFVRELGFTYDLDELARFWHDYDGAMRHWRDQHAQAILEMRLEHLVAAPEEETRRLLDFCGLPFDDACVRFHDSARGVRTLSADQVRDPLRPQPQRGPFYGRHVDRLRALLAGDAGPGPQAP